MTRQTSIDVYQEIKASGLLSARRWEVYRWLYSNGSATANEIAEGLGGRDRGATACRCTDLRKRQVVAEKGTRICKVTGRNVIEWMVVRGQLPVNPSRQEPIGMSRGRLIEEVRKLRDANRRLKSRVSNLTDKLNQGRLF